MQAEKAYFAVAWVFELKEEKENIQRQKEPF